MTVALAKAKTDREIRFVTLTPFREANGVTIDPIGRTARCIIITEGLGNLRDRNYYTADAIESAAEVFEGKQFYINHPSESEEDDRPERDVRDLAGWFSGCQVGYIIDPQTKERLRACFANLHFDEAEGGETAMAKVKAALAYQKQFPLSKDVYAGISINGGGISHPGSIKGVQVNMVTEIQEAFSADIVTKPARGGRFLALVKEAAKAAAWSGSRTQKSRESLPRMGAEGGRHMATAVKDKKDKGKPAKEALTAEQKEAKLKEQRKLRFHATNLMLEVKSIKRQAKEAEAQDNLDAYKEVASEKLKTAGAKFQKMKANADAAGGELADLLLDIQQDIGELSKMIGMGGAADGEEVPAEDVPAEDGVDAAEMTGEDEQEKEGEGEDEQEKESEGGEQESEDEKEQETTAEGEGGEQESEDEEEKEATEGEDEQEGEEGFGGDDDEDDEDAEYGMGDEEEESDQAMRFKCGKCGETNNVATPKGFRLVAAESKMGESERGMQGFVAKLQRQLEAKEGRFVKTNHKLAKVLKENFKLRARVTAYDRMEEAGKLLKEANIPADILPVKDLVTLYEPEQWGAAIRNAKRMLEREQKLLGKAPRLKEGQGGDGDHKDDEKDDSLLTSFTESYNKK